MSTVAKGALRITPGANGWDTVVEIDGNRVLNVQAIRVEFNATGPPRVELDLLGLGPVFDYIVPRQWTERHLCERCGKVEP